MIPIRLAVLSLVLVASTLPAQTQVAAGPSSHHFPSTYTYGSLNGVAVPSSTADWRFEVDHLDMAHGEQHFAGVKARDPNFFYIKYQLMETTIIGTEERNIATYCTRLNYDPENAYLHYADDTIVESAGKRSSIKGFGKGSASKRQDSRIRKDIWGSPRWVYNWADPCTRAYMKARSAQDITEKQGGAHFDGIFIDEIGAPDVANSISLPKEISGGHIAEFGDKTREEIVASGDYFRAFSGLFADVTAAMKQASHGKSLFFPNIGNYSSDGVVALGLATDGLLTESLSYENAVYSGRGEARLWDMAKALADKGKVYLFAQGSEKPPTDLHFDAGNYSSPADRHEMYALASYWMARQGASTYYLQHSRWQPLASFWVKAQEHDIGQPKGDYFIWKENSQPGDAAGQKFRVYRRDYTKAIVLFRTRFDWDARNFKDYSSPSDTYDLGGWYRILYPSGKLGPPIERIAMRLSEGVVLIPAGPAPAQR